MVQNYELFLEIVLEAVNILYLKDKVVNILCFQNKYWYCCCKTEIGHLKYYDIPTVDEIVKGDSVSLLVMLMH